MLGLYTHTSNLHPQSYILNDALAWITLQPVVKYLRLGGQGDPPPPCFKAAPGLEIQYGAIQHLRKQNFDLF